MRREAEPLDRASQVFQQNTKEWSITPAERPAGPTLPTVRLHHSPADVLFVRTGAR